MNDPANTRQWQVGDYVIHDADAKHDGGRMLMRVVGYNRQGACLTRYMDPTLQAGRKPWANAIAWLHDPAPYGIPLPPVQP